MALKTPNNSANVNIASGVSAWFQKDFSGSYKELGDLVVDELTLQPEFQEVKSYRNGGYSTLKRILTDRTGSFTITLREASVVNLQRVLYGGAVASSQSVDVLDGRNMVLYEDSTGLYVDFNDVEDASVISSITALGCFAQDSVLETSGGTWTNAVPNSSGFCYIDAVGAPGSAGDTVYVRYKIAQTGMYSTEIYGSADATIEGAARVQARNQAGGIVQIWDLASVQLQPGGGLSYSPTEVQSFQMTMNLQERSGTFGKVYIS